MASVYPNPCAAACSSVQGVELTPDEITDGVVHMVAALVFIRFTAFGIALQL
jgi:hypothetical protein